MIDIKNYILESKITVDKEELKHNIDKIDSQAFLKKIELSIKDYVDGSWEDSKKYVNTEYLSKHCGYNPYIVSTIVQKIKHHHQYKTCKTLFEQIIDNSGKDINNKDVNYFTSNKLINNTNIYNLLLDFAKSVIPDFDESKFKALLEDIANFNIPGKTGVGKFEILTSLFLKDLNDHNDARQGSVVCDINTKDKGLEYKLSSARITGNKEESRPLHPKLLDKTFRDLATSQLVKLYNIDNIGIDTEKNRSNYSSSILLKVDDDELDKNLNNKDIIDYINKLEKLDNIFRKETNINKNVGDLFKFGVSANNINIILVSALVSQLPQKEFKVSNEDISDIAQKYPIINEEGLINIQMFKNIWLVLHLCNYKAVEQWDYMILFDKKVSSGNYKIINVEKIDINSMFAAIEGKAKGGGLPCWGSGTTTQNYAPQIMYIN